MCRKARSWARKARLALVEKLGGKCRQCGSVLDLELDHIVPTGETHRSYRRMDPSMRVAAYRREAARGEL